MARVSLPRSHSGRMARAVARVSGRGSQSPQHRQLLSAVYGALKLRGRRSRNVPRSEPYFHVEHEALDLGAQVLAVPEPQEVIVAVELDEPRALDVLGDVAPCLGRADPVAAATQDQR